MSSTSQQNSNIYLPISILLLMITFMTMYISQLCRHGRLACRTQVVGLSRLQLSANALPVIYMRATGQVTWAPTESSSKQIKQSPAKNESSSFTFSNASLYDFVAGMKWQTSAHSVKALAIASSSLSHGI